MRNKSVVIGLTGNIGAGKNVVADILRSHGAAVIDADETSHRIMRNGHEAYDEVVSAFGTEILLKNGEIDRKKLGKIVFNDKIKLDKLVKITHKYIIKDNLTSLSKFKKDGVEIIVLNAPLLVESGMNEHTDTVWFVFAEENLRIERVIIRDGVDRESVTSRIKSQTRPLALMQAADETIENNGTLEELKEKIDNLIKNLDSIGAM